jgi:hypothetical protein
MLYYLHCSIVKHLLPVQKKQNGVVIQDGVENDYIFHPIFSKIMFLSVFYIFDAILNINAIFIF